MKSIIKKFFMAIFRLINQATTLSLLRIVFVFGLMNQTATVYAGIGTVGGLFLQEDVSARTLGMGSAFTAVSDDSNGMYSNPAGLDYVPYPEATMMYRQGFLDTYCGSVNYLQPLMGKGTLAIGIMKFDGGNIELKYLDGRVETVKMEQDMVTTIGYGHNLTFLHLPASFGEKIFLGANVKFIQSTLGGIYNANTSAVDFGVLYRTIEGKFSVGLSMQNFGTGLKYRNTADQLPTTTKLGIAYRSMEWSENSVITAIDLIQTINEPMKTNLGIEWRFSKMFALRAGYKIGYAPNMLTFGFGFLTPQGQLDYSYVSSMINPTQRFSYTFKFGSLDRPKIAKRYEEKGMYEKAQYIHSPENYQYARAKTEGQIRRFAPIITSIEPKRASPGYEVTIYGVKFDEKQNIEVKFGNILAYVMEANQRKVVVKVPANVRAGETKIIVKTPRGESDPEPFSVVPSKSPMLKITGLSFEDENGNKVLEAEENGKIIFYIKNEKGAGESFDIKVKPQLLNQQPSITYSNVIKLGDVSPGEQKRIEIPISAGLDVLSGEVNFKINITEANGFNPDPVEIKIPTAKLKPPDINLVKFEIDDGIYPDNPEKLAVGNNNGKIEPGESVEVMATVLNKGTGPAKNTACEIVSENPAVTFLTENEINLGEIKSGEWKEIKFAIRLEKKYSWKDNLPLNIKITDARERFNKNIPLNIAIGKVYPKIQLLEVKGNLTETPQVAMPSFGADLYPVPLGKESKPDTVAVVIGVRNYKNKDVPQVEYALNDAHLVKEYLIKLLGYREGNIIYLENPTKGDFERVFGSEKSHKGELFNYVRADKSDVFVYYVGHGAPDLETKDAYFVPADCHPNYVKLNGYSLDLFYENMSKIPAKNTTVVIDACFSGGSEKGMLIAKASPLAVVPTKGNVSEKITRYTSSSGDEISSWYPEKQHGLFTYFFLKALQGDADKNKDKELTFGEIKSYLDDNVPYQARRMYGRTQTPTFIGNESKIMVKY